MGLEIERKFLLKNNTWKALAHRAEPIQQGYLSLEPARTVRVRLTWCVPSIIEKTRYLVKHDGLVWEIDVFEGDNKGLEVAEIELESEAQVIMLPTWIGQEVSHEARYYNANLIIAPFKNW